MLYVEILHRYLTHGKKLSTLNKQKNPDTKEVSGFKVCFLLAY